MGINRKVVEVYCDVCKLTFLSQAVLDTHLTGYKHQRKLKSIELLETLRKTEQCFELDSVSGEIRCLFCDITLNSPQHLSTHVKGDKHIMEKGKRENGDQGGTPAKKLRPGAPEQRNGGAPKPTTKKTTTPPQPTKVKIPPPAKKERPPLNITIPAYVTKVEDNKAGGKFLCNPCQAHCNSDIQLSQHLKSKKHLDKVSGKKSAPPSSGKGTGRSWRGGSSSYGSGRGRGGSSTLGGSGSSSSRSWNNSLSSSSGAGSGGGYGSSTSSAVYNQSSFPETVFSSSSASSNYNTDSYGLSSLGRSATTDYDYGSYARAGGNSSSSGSADRGWGASRAGGGSFQRSDTYSHQQQQQQQPETVDYGRATEDVYTRTESYPRADAYTRAEAYPRAESAYPRAESAYPRADYGGADYGARSEDVSAYGRASAADYATHGYVASQGVSHHSAVAAAAAGTIPFTYTPPLSQNFVGGGAIL